MNASLRKEVVGRSIGSIIIKRRDSHSPRDGSDFKFDILCELVHDERRVGTIESQGANMDESSIGLVFGRTSGLLGVGVDRRDARELDLTIWIGLSIHIILHVQQFLSVVEFHGDLVAGVGVQMDHGQG